MQELEKILEEIELEKKRLVFYPDCSSAFSAVQIRTIEKIEQIICKYMSNCKQINAGWIPVEERLPKTNGTYNVTRHIDGHFISDSAYFDGQNTWHSDNRVNHSRPYLTDVIAWRPLPEPYRPERSSENEK